MVSHKFNLFADYFQFYIQDEQSKGNLSERWTEEAVKNMLALAEGIIGVGTVRNMIIPVEVAIWESEPTDNITKWDKINECDINIPSGKLVVTGCADYFPEAKRIVVKSGLYRARIYYGNLNSLSEDGLYGDDYYKIALWLSDDTSVHIIKN